MEGEKKILEQLQKGWWVRKWTEKHGKQQIALSGFGNCFLVDWLACGYCYSCVGGELTEFQ